MPVLPVFTLGFNLILNEPVPLEYWFLFLLPRSSFALFTCGFTSLTIGSGGGAVGVLEVKVLVELVVMVVVLVGIRLRTLDFVLFY